MREAVYDAQAYRVTCGRHDNGDRLSRSFRRDHWRGGHHDNDIGTEPNQLCGKSVECYGCALKKPIFGLEVLSLDVTEFPESVLPSLDQIRNDVRLPVDQSLRWNLRSIRLINRWLCTWAHVTHARPGFQFFRAPAGVLGPTPFRQ